MSRILSVNVESVVIDNQATPPDYRDWSITCTLETDKGEFKTGPNSPVNDDIEKFVRAMPNTKPVPVTLMLNPQGLVIGVEFDKSLWDSRERCYCGGMRILVGDWKQCRKCGYREIVVPE